MKDLLWFSSKGFATALLILQCLLFGPGALSLARADADDGASCEVAGPDSRGWSAQERWVWTQLCQGKAADLRVRTASKEAESYTDRRPSWSDESVLSPEFLRSLFESPLREKLEQTGIVIRGARFERDTTLDLAFVKFKRRVFLKETLFRGSVRLTDAVLDGSLSFTKSIIKGDLDIAGAKIGRDLWLEGITVHGETRLRDLRIGRNLYLWRGASFGTIDLLGGRINGDLRLSGSTFRGPIDMSNVEIGRHLFARRYASKKRPKPTRFRGAIVLRNASIGGRLEFIGIRARGVLDMDAIRVKEDIFLRDCSQFRSNVNMVFAKIGQNLDLSGSQFRDLDATGARIAGELRLGSSRHPRPTWSPDAKLNLRNAQVFSWQHGYDDVGDTRFFQGGCTGSVDSVGPWPSKLEISGFGYEQLGGLGGSGQSEILGPKRRDDLVKHWLKRDETYSPQPYEQLAKVVKTAGYRDLANRILYDSKEEERRNAKGTEWAWLTTLKLVMGYGFRYSNALYWVIGMVAMGMIVLGITREGLRNKMPIGFFYSLDVLLPIVRLREFHQQVQLRGFARYYFYFHKLVGYFLASILIAGFSGLTR